jgi:hypothetical protein
MYNAKESVRRKTMEISGITKALLSIMLFAVILAGLTLLFSSIVLDKRTPEQVARDVRQQAVSYDDRRASSLALDMFYFQDSKTGICFAASGVGQDWVMATVDCDKVPAAVLHHPSKSPSN